MIQTFVYKIYKGRKNKYLNQQIDIAGIIYNHCIALHKTYYRIYKKHLNKFRLQTFLTKLKEKKKYAFWGLLGSQAIQDITDRIDRAYKLFYKIHKNNKKSSPPSFKKVKKYKSFTLKQAGYKFLEGNKIKIGKKIFKYSKSRSFEGEIKTVTIKRDALGDFYLIVATDTKEIAKKSIMTGKIAGIDFGLKTFLTCSNHEKKESPLFYKESSKKIAKANRELSRKEQNSNQRKKTKKKLARLYRDLCHSRRNYFFQLAHELLNKYDYLFFEDLHIKAMQKLWGKKISDLAFSSFLEIIVYVAKKKGKTVHKINRFFPSSKMCCHCKNINNDLDLKDRFWTCPHCLAKLDRDINAAINILREGASSLGLDIVRLEYSSEYCLKLESNVL